MLVIVVVIVVIFLILIFTFSRSRENFDSYYPQNVRLWPQNYYSFPFNTKYGEGWPPYMYSRTYYMSPSFYMGSGLSYYYRPTSHFDPYRITRHRWVRNNGKYFQVSNRLDYVNDSADYRNMLPFGL